MFTNLVPLLEHTVSALQPFAKANFVRLQFRTDKKELKVCYRPENIIPDLVQLLCRIITFTPQEYEVSMEVKEVKSPRNKIVAVHIINTGARLDQLKDIVSGLRCNVQVSPLNSYKNEKSIVKRLNGTLFEIRYFMDPGEVLSEKSELIYSFGEKEYIIPPFYQKFKKRLNAHFISIQNLEKTAARRSERDGVFLKKMNAIILANLEKEGFDTISLCKAMALSRSQLYRKLKQLTSIAPGHYIRYTRLQKAKEFLENKELTVGEVAFRSGFINQGHFSRVFREQFGFNPSDLKRNQKKRISKESKLEYHE